MDEIIEEKQEEICSIKSLIFYNQYKLTIKKSSTHEIIFEVYNDYPLNPEFFWVSLDLEKIRGLGKNFKLGNTVDEIVGTLKNLKEQENIFLKKDKSGLFIEIKSKITSDKDEIITIKLQKREESNEEIMKTLVKEIETLKEEKNEMKNQIENLTSSLIKDKKKNITSKLSTFVSISLLILLVSLIVKLKKNLEKLNNVIEKYSEILDPMINKKEEEKKFLSLFNTSLVQKIEEGNLLISALANTKVFNNSKIDDLKFDLLYSTSRDEWNDSGFREKCNNNNNTLAIIRTTQNRTFGGFTTKKWDKGDGYEKDDDNAFLFSFVTSKFYPIINGKFATYTNGFGPQFVSKYTWMISFYSENLRDDGWTTEGAGSHYSGITTDFEINGGDPGFTVAQMDIIKISKK